jgi:hypothetical protein
VVAQHRPLDLKGFLLRTLYFLLSSTVWNWRVLVKNWSKISRELRPKIFPSMLALDCRKCVDIDVGYAQRKVVKYRRKSAIPYASRLK